MKTKLIKKIFRFKFPAGTSKGVLLNKESWFLILEENGMTGIGECSTIPGISTDKMEGYTEILESIKKSLEVDRHISPALLNNYPSIAFGVEMALLDLKTGGKRELFKTPFAGGTAGILINGLVWMGDRLFMEEQLQRKISEGFHCIKLKIGSLQFDTECEILANIRKKYSPENLEIRLDANGAFSEAEALGKLKILSTFGIHSIEQPIKKGLWSEMAQLCANSPIPIALDEEITDYSSFEARNVLLQTINPHYIIIKPSMLGGFKKSMEWIQSAESAGIGWWITSALESNIGLNAIAQWTSSFRTLLPQGLGTGQLYENNFLSPLEIVGEKLYYRPENEWNINLLVQ
jgi:o-succinylbenzoate synthase